MMLRPFFSFYGSKWRAAPLYPVPRFDTVIEPFAGSAGYSLRHPSRDVRLFDLDPCIVGVWRYLIRTSRSEIERLPLLAPGDDVRDLPVCPEAQSLIGFWVNRGSATPGRMLSSWALTGPRPHLHWGPFARARIASQVDKIRHWRITLGSYETAANLEATWYVDPPYLEKGKHYRCSSSAIDFAALGQWCQARDGQVIVCEQAGANWLPFQPLANVKATRGRSREVVWTNAEVQGRIEWTGASH